MGSRIYREVICDGCGRDIICHDDQDMFPPDWAVVSISYPDGSKPTTEGALCPLCIGRVEPFLSGRHPVRKLLIRDGRRQAEAATLREEGLSWGAIAKRLGYGSGPAACAAARAYQKKALHS